MKKKAQKMIAITCKNINDEGLDGIHRLANFGHISYWLAILAQNINGVITD